MLCTILLVVGLVWWALHLMEQAVQRHEFSRMMAGMMVVAAAGGVLTTYFFMSDYLAFLQQAHTMPMPQDYSLVLGDL